ncbi:coatomer subunit delta [Mucor ambiguus]|uniref:Coatomer subunit delta n=1 Tax=Mucor ambiguus TaxID=91626 RepID=A0A0C9MI63_9FUNG|nr:coatomer subunit delta [Mucor ambiguus]
MVVLAAAVVTKSGKAVISRQFHEMQRSRIEGLLASFPKLTSTGQQHTTVETEHVRFVYQPLDELFMVLITNRQSNILQDIESLHLFARVVTDLCRSCDEMSILRNAFELLCAFDEIISVGYRENVNLSQVKSSIEMESHEERIQEIIAKNKEQEAKEELKRRAKQFEMQRKEAQKRGQGFMQGNFNSSNSSMMGGYGGGGSGYSPSSESLPSMRESPSSYSRPSSNAPSAASKAKGMQLGRKPKAADLFEAIKPDVEEPLLNTTSSYHQKTAQSNQESVHIDIEERVSVAANKDGGLEQMEVRGVLTLKIADSASARISLALKASDDASIQFKTHPNVDKNAWKDQHIVQMRDLSRPFPANQNLEVVRWKLSTRDETAVPLTITCWPSPAGNGTCDVNVEYELENDDLELRDVVISIPLPAEPTADVTQADGSYFVDRARRVLEWQLPVINSSNKSGLLECSIPGDDANSFFPVVVSFMSEKLICGVDVLSISNVENNSEAPYSKEILMTAEDYVVG